MLDSIADCQTRFKPHLDRSKYPQRHADELRAWAARDGAVATAVAESDPRAGAPWGSPAGSAHAPGLVGPEFGTERHAAVLAAYVAAQHALAGAYLQALNARLDEGGAHLFGERPALADFAIAPFVRQYAAVDAARWASGPWPALRAWLAGLLARPEFEWAVMRKVPVWQAPTSGAAT
ncbi:hypothetical protein CCO03_07300 [Comamonas serinivorans]|uniref:GST C-terminal domain-containing protein n=2 Tax=Comamonas serinivorans TaxID=1082851 RepID=A0A1Y0ESS3_9BURK|nr:hypothetical protein CCO03_07300 [Comamonas serinivorans]